MPEIQLRTGFPEMITSNKTSFIKSKTGRNYIMIFNQNHTKEIQEVILLSHLIKLSKQYCLEKNMYNCLICRNDVAALQWNTK